MQISFIVVCLLSVLLFHFGTGSSRRLLLIFVGWQFIIGSVAIAHVFEDCPNVFPFAIIGTLLLVIYCLRKIEVQKTNLKFLLAIHILRIPVEIVLYLLFLKGKVPELMTFSGWNFDILIGMSAFVLLILWLIFKRKIHAMLFVAWNYIGILFLLFIVALAILSSPLPIQQLAFEQPNKAVLEFSYCLLPTCVVPIVLMSHLLILKSLK